MVKIASTAITKSNTTGAEDFLFTGLEPCPALLSVFLYGAASAGFAFVLASAFACGLAFAFGLAFGLALVLGLALALAFGFALALGLTSVSGLSVATASVLFSVQSWIMLNRETDVISEIILKLKNLTA